MSAAATTDIYSTPFPTPSHIVPEGMTSLEAVSVKTNSCILIYGP